MKHLLLISFLLATVVLHAQENTVKKDSVVSDTTKFNVISTLDSAKLKSDKAINKVTAAPGKITSEVSELNKKLSISPQELSLGKISSPADSLQRSVGNISEGSKKLNDLTDVRSQADEAITKPMGEAKKVQGKLNNVQKEPAEKIESKLNILSKETAGKGNIPTNLPSADLNKGNAILPDLKGLPSGTSIDGKLPSMDQPSLPETSLKSPGLSGFIDVPKDLDKKIGVDKVNDLKKNTDELSKVSEKASGYTKDIKSIKEGNVDKAETIQKEALSKVPGSDELQGLQKQQELMKSQQEQFNSFRNPDEYKKQTLARARKMVTLQLATQQSKIQESVVKLSRYQDKTASIIKISKKADLPKKRDDWKRLKKHEHFVPGITLQVQKPNGWLIDINPSLRYRMTTYWSAGAGWNERLDFGDYLKSYSKGRVYGPRAFSELILFKGFSFRTDMESLNMFVAPSVTAPSDAGKRIWLWNYLLGLKKEFSFIPGIIGNAQFMYNIYSSSQVRAYPNKFNVRVGFEFPMKKKKAKNNSSLK